MEQDVILTSRERMEISGVEEVERFTDGEIVLVTALGRAVVEGSSLRIESFSTERGALVLRGEIDGFSYEDPADDGERRGFFGRIFH
ncbi:MAG: sporulation protein [Clostridia bacterium]|nr:sporulation protein [Clostridia bacterium]